jgi:hypothetical protein
VLRPTHDIKVIIWRAFFNASLEGNTRRAIDIREGETIDATALKALIREAVAVNKGKGRRNSL